MVGGSLRVLRFPPPHDLAEILLNVALKDNKSNQIKQLNVIGYIEYSSKR